MSYKEDFKIKDAMQSLYSLGKIASTNVFTGSRPQAVPEQMKDFVVVNIVGSVSSSTYGGGYGMSSGYCSFEIYARLKKGGMEDQNKMEKMLSDIIGQLPYSDNVLQISRPSVMLKGNDGLGFSAMLIRAELSIK